MTWVRSRFLTQRELNLIRGKSLVGHATPDEILQVFGHYDLIEHRLDELDYDDVLGTEGWRHRFGLPDAD